MTEARIGEVIEMDAEAVPVGELPGKFNPRAELEREAEVLSSTLGIVAGGEAGSKEDVVAEEEIEVDPKIRIEAPLCGGHDTNEGTKLKVLIRRSETLDVELVLHLKLKSSVLGPVKIIGADGKREQVGRASRREA